MDFDKSDRLIADTLPMPCLSNPTDELPVDGVTWIMIQGFVPSKPGCNTLTNAQRMYWQSGDFTAVALCSLQRCEAVDHEYQTRVGKT